MAIVLEKEVEKVKKITLEKSGGSVPVCRVGVALDVSGSMIGNYTSGKMGNVLTRLLAIALTFDDDGNMETWAFDTGVKKLRDITESNYRNYVRDEMGHVLGGGTAFAPCASAVYNNYFGKARVVKEVHEVEVEKPSFFGLFSKKKTVQVETETVVGGNSDENAFVIFITDGESDTLDYARLEQQLKESDESPIYWCLVGINDSSGYGSNFSALERLADAYPNVGFIDMSGHGVDIDNDQLYDKIISEEMIEKFS